MPDLTISPDFLAAAVRALDTQAARAGIDSATAVDLQALKVVEELGEAVAALIGMTGQNPRKGVTHTQADLLGELYDVALTALVDAASVHYSMLDGVPGSIRVTYAVPPGEPQATFALALLVQASG
ncbi:MazG-like family protein, partial [Parafrankia soli]|uniref:MazG-like family protein n=1 Tax=Parafrankia soli TaxID=2599596 RepID=UPI0018E2DBA8